MPGRRGCAPWQRSSPVARLREEERDGTVLGILTVGTWAVPPTTWRKNTPGTSAPACIWASNEPRCCTRATGLVPRPHPSAARVLRSLRAPGAIGGRRPCGAVGARMMPVLLVPAWRPAPGLFAFAGIIARNSPTRRTARARDPHRVVHHGLVVSLPRISPLAFAAAVGLRRDQRQRGRVTRTNCATITRAAPARSTTVTHKGLASSCNRGRF